jgi:hypothetical protein
MMEENLFELIVKGNGAVSVDVGVAVDAIVDHRVASEEICYNLILL